MKRLFIDIAHLGCYLLIPIVIFIGIESLAMNKAVGIGVIVLGPVFTIALATVFQYVGKIMDSENPDLQLNKPLNDLSGTPWEKKKRSNNK